MDKLPPKLLNEFVDALQKSGVKTPEEQIQVIVTKYNQLVANYYSNMSVRFLLAARKEKIDVRRAAARMGQVLSASVASVLHNASFLKEIAKYKDAVDDVIEDFYNES